MMSLWLNDLELQRSIQDVHIATQSMDRKEGTSGLDVVAACYGCMNIAPKNVASSTTLSSVALTVVRLHCLLVDTDSRLKVWLIGYCVFCTARLR